MKTMINMNEMFVSAIRELNPGYEATNKTQLINDLENGEISLINVELFNLGLNVTVDGGSTIATYTHEGDIQAEIDLADLFVAKPDYKAITKEALNHSHYGPGGTRVVDEQYCIKHGVMFVFINDSVLCTERTADGFAGNKDYGMWTMAELYA